MLKMMTVTLHIQIPDSCIASPPPQLNCDDITDKNFRVLPPDPHGFDSEGDGIGCEEEE